MKGLSGSGNGVPENLKLLSEVRPLETITDFHKVDQMALSSASLARGPGHSPPAEASPLWSANTLSRWFAHPCPLVENHPGLVQHLVRRRGRTSSRLLRNAVEPGLLAQASGLLELAPRAQEPLMCALGTSPRELEYSSAAHHSALMGSGKSLE